MQRKQSQVFVLFQPQKNYLVERTVFVNALNTFFGMLGENLKAFHLSEFIREIGNFYLAGVKRHHLSERPTSIQFMCFHLLEKAMILEPASENAQRNYDALLGVVPMLMHDKGVFNDEIRNSRLEGYRDQLRARGARAFFNETLVDHLDDLGGVYPNDLRMILHHVLDYLVQTESYQHICAKYLDSKQQAALQQIFDRTKNALMNVDRREADHQEFGLSHR